MPRVLGVHLHLFTPKRSDALYCSTAAEPVVIHLRARPSWLPPLCFLLPDTVLVSPGPHGFNTAVLPGNVVRIRGREARHCLALAREFFAVVAWDRAFYLPRRPKRWQRERQCGFCVPDKNLSYALRAVILG